MSLSPFVYDKTLWPIVTSCNTALNAAPLTLSQLSKYRAFFLNSGAMRKLRRHLKTYAGLYKALCPCLKSSTAAAFPTKQRMPL